jgi:trehalose 6-phosphate synthase
MGDFQPIRLAIRHHAPDEVFKLFRAADSCLVTSLHDGMNLVAKEFVAAHDDGLGVLILSSFAGASRELTEALIVNPHNTNELGESIYRAVMMTEREQRERMRHMRTVVHHNNVYRWAGQMLLDAASVRKRELAVSLRTCIAKSGWHDGWRAERASMKSIGDLAAGRLSRRPS